MKKWVITAKRADFQAIAERFHIDQVTARLIRNRDVCSEEEISRYLHGTLSDLYDPHLMYGTDKAVKILQSKIFEKKKIRIIGDYDIDGVTATYILYRCLLTCGADVDYEIPDRIKDGYGLNENLVRAAHEDGVDTILTCDNGISAIDQIALGKSLCMTIIVTDHHELKMTEKDGILTECLPQADVVINPHQSRCAYPFKQICGAVVAYKLMQCLFEAYGFPSSEIRKYIEFAAIATVGDVMDLTDENRIIVKEGLKQLNRTTSVGLKALITVNSLVNKEIDSYHIGFVIGPCINASGRLDTAKKALELFLTESETRAAILAEELLELNNERKALTLKGYEEAVEQIENSDLKHDKVLVVYLPDCHESLAGIIAGRIRERYYRPVIVLTDGETNVKGSGRSIETYSMFSEMEKCAELFVNFGGHPMAAGCSLKQENVEKLREFLNEHTTLTDEDIIEKIKIDVPMPIDYISEQLIEELQVLEPFGKANPKPVFAAKDLRVCGLQIMGQNRNVCKLKLMSSHGTMMDALYFGDIEVFRSYMEEKYSVMETRKLFMNQNTNMTISVIYYPQVNVFRDRKSLQIIISQYQ